MADVLNAPVRHYATIDSTNLEAQRLCANGLREATWLLADEQTAGIGRENRNWVSEQGNLYTTLIVDTPAAMTKTPQLSLVGAVALYDAISVFIDPQFIRIKWPNDLLVEGKKLSGILVQNIAAAPQYFAIGIGVNVAYAPMRMPYPVTCLNHYNRTTPQDVFAALKQALSSSLKVWANGDGFEDVRRQWLQRAKCLGQKVRIITGSNQMEGTFTNLSAEGALIITLSDGRTQLAHAGDVKFIESETT